MIIPKNVTTESLEELCATLNFIDIWIKLSEENYEIRSGMYNKAMKEMFKQITLTMIKAITPKISSETYDINWWWMAYGKIAKGLPPSRISTLRKKAQDKEDEI